MFWHSGPHRFQHLRMALYPTIPSRRKLLFVRFDRSNSCTDHSVFGHPIWHLLGYRGATCCCLFLVLSIIHSPGGGTTLPEKEREPRLRCIGVGRAPSIPGAPSPPPPPPGALSRSGQLRARRARRARRVAPNGESGEKSPLHLPR